MLTREEILSGFKKIDFPDKLFDESVKSVKNLLFFQESIQPASQKEKDTKKLSQCYVLPWRLVQKNNPEIANNKNTFIRGGNFVPKEPLINIKIENFKLLYDKYSLPPETGLIYFKNNYGGINGPYNLEQIKNLQKNKKLDSTYEFRLIDIFCFKDSELFSFQSVKIINDDNWADIVIDSPLLKYNQTFKNNNEAVKEEKQIEVKKEEKKEEVKPKEPKKEDIKPIEPKKDDIKPIETKQEDIKLIETKQEDKTLDVKKEEKKEDIKEDKKDEKKINQIKKETEGKWEVVGKKKKANKDKEEESNQIIGLKTKESKEGNKKGKKKKKGQFEDTNFELGFKIK
jgi:hypothetical protein